MSAEKCHFDNSDCGGDLWTCQTCGLRYCESHGHRTAKGKNVECAACEYNAADYEKQYKAAEPKLASYTGYESIGSAIVNVMPVGKLIARAADGREIEVLLPDWIKIDTELMNLRLTMPHDKVADFFSSISPEPSTSTSEKLKQLMASCKCGVHIHINDHRDVYETAEQYLEQMNSNCNNTLVIDPVVRAEMIRTNTILQVQCYPRSPTSFFYIFHYDLDVALSEALQAMERTEVTDGASVTTA